MLLLPFFLGEGFDDGLFISIGGISVLLIAQHPRLLHAGDLVSVGRHLSRMMKIRENTGESRHRTININTLTCTNEDKSHAEKTAFNSLEITD